MKTFSDHNDGYWSLVRSITSPKGHWSDGCCCRRNCIEKGRREASIWGV